MLVRASNAVDRVPADDLFPGWRGREPFDSRRDAVAHSLHARHPGLAAAVAAVPFAAFEAPWSRAAVYRYTEVPEAAEAIVQQLPEALSAPYLCALMLWHIGRFETAFAASGLHPEFALHYADAFHRILDQIEADPGFASLASDSFLKDLWLARIVMVPAFAQIWWPRSGLAGRDVAGGGAKALAYVLFACRGRRPFLEGHTHDPVAKAYWNEAGWQEALRLAALALPAFPAARGVFGTAWFYDPAILEVSPRIAFAQTLQLGRGALRIRIGSNAAAIANATATSASRRNLYREGRYLPADHAIIWSRKALLGAYGA